MTQSRASKAIAKTALAITAHIASLFMFSYGINNAEAININDPITQPKATTGSIKELVAIKPSSNF
ncbi:MAG: hypothetical protein ACKPCM_07465, partial [Pseudanabaena sp.]